MRPAVHKVPKSHRFDSAEKLLDRAGLVAMVLIAAAMIVGLLTATGHTSW